MSSLNSNNSQKNYSLLRNQSCNKCSKKSILRSLNNSRNRKLVKAFILLTCVLIYILIVKMLENRVLLSEEITENIKAVLQTRITAVRLMPNTNTTKLTPTFKCENLFGIILINSTPENFMRRNILRKTWFNFLSGMNEKVKAFFFVGVPGEEEISENLMQEYLTWNDIILEDLEENYYLLALKSLRMLKWQNSTNHCLRANYIIKTDDDMFLHVPNIVNHIQSVPNAWINYIGGQLHMTDKVDGNPFSKRFAPLEWWPEGTYPPFVSGALTVMSSEVVPQLLKGSLDVPLFHLEDVFLIGMVGFEKLQILPKEMPGIESNNPLWIVRLKMFFSFKSLPKTYLAFHCSEDINFISELYLQAMS